MRLVATLQVDLPSDQVWKKPGAIARWFGATPHKVNMERVVLSTFETFDAFVEAFRALDVTNVVSLKIDDYTFFKDKELLDDDLDEMVAVLEENRDLVTTTFDRIQLDMETEVAGIHYVIGTTIRGKVRPGDKEVEVSVAGRIQELEAEAGETAVAYAKRVRGLVNTAGYLADYERRVEAFVNPLLDELEIATDSPDDATFERLEAAVFWPNKHTLNELTSKPFVDQSIRLRATAPSGASAGVCHDRYSHFYYNPFDTLADLVIIDAAFAGEITGLTTETAVYAHDDRRLGTTAAIDKLTEELGGLRELVSADSIACFEEGKPLPLDPSIWR